MTKHIYIYSPSSAVRDKAAFRRGVKRLKALGHEVEVDDAALSVHQRFAGDDATRLAAISRAAASGADVALISRGGYGLTRILDAIPYKAVAKAIDKGTEFVGCSDFTALQNALLVKTGAVTWSGPAVGEDFGAEAGADDIMEACFDDLVTGQGEGTGWRMPARDADLKFKPVQDAVLWGGNLCVLASLIGTPYFPVVDKGVLFIEDINEHPYRIERMLDQLKMAGVLARQRAIVFGQFTGIRKAPGYDRGFGLNTVIDRLRASLKVPVLAGLPFGHVPTKVLLPVGAKVSMAAEGRDVFLVWGHRHTPAHDDHHGHDHHHHGH
ncbi:MULTISPECIES: LD-carboxypeptidase [Variovorax]|uniref:LD-carboxypeptidase n=1 Tax=Variovorax TaxID=34072 RepID=UPI00089746F6|nr:MULTISPECIES: LD-carboxypeptidase [Variovorax]MDQ0080589.1 muramoyltetrapeptide carboxypeptidase [Variovorax boronicumulans]SDY74188.1 muramoyltetrapeptide carboxypeptidase [Variovorax sp. YR266]SES94303.1 muramoyltetrapeptide carboxypeptidase [Variovorax sp. OV084]